MFSVVINSCSKQDWDNCDRPSENIFILNWKFTIGIRFNSNPKTNERTTVLEGILAFVQVQVLFNRKAN